MGLHTVARATKDIDFSALADVEQATRLVDVMQHAGWSATAHGPLGPGAVVRFSRTGQDGVARWVDVLFSGTDFEERALRRAKTTTLFGHAIRVATVEDLIVFKMVAGRPQDLVDVQSLLKQNGDGLDEAYLAGALAEWELSGAFARLREEI
ncbi:MAG: nucleotidyl transferase AbiEii/AbiGii toxin family protein [Myxococcales bacterium]|nr:nucleotidyl transferase AbiEii/AbiGii toxin family protein [Myxococcales bacterium]